MHFLFQNQFSISNSGLVIHTFNTHNTLYGNEAVILLPLSPTSLQMYKSIQRHKTTHGMCPIGHKE